MALPNRNRTSSGISGSQLAGILLALLIAAGSLWLFLTEFNSISEARRQSVGEAVPQDSFTPAAAVVGQWDVTVYDMTYSDEAALDSDPRHPAAEGFRYCTALLSVKNLSSDEAVFLGPDDAFLTASVLWNGQEFLPIREGSLLDVVVPPLQKETATLLFALPQEAILSEVRPALTLQSGEDRLVCGLIQP